MTGKTQGSVRGGSAVPEAGPEVVAAGHEARIGGGVHDAAHNVIVSQRQQVLALRRARVPAAQADGALVRQQHVVLGVVEHALGPVHLAAAQPSACAQHGRNVSRGEGGRESTTSPVPYVLQDSTGAGSGAPNNPRTPSFTLRGLCVLGRV